MFGPKLRYLFRVSDKEVIGHNVEHEKRKKSVISDFLFKNFHHTLFWMTDLKFRRYSKKWKIGKIQIFEANLLTLSQVSVDKVIGHDVEHEKMNKSFFSDF